MRFRPFHTLILTCCAVSVSLAAKGQAHPGAAALDPFRAQDAFRTQNASGKQDVSGAQDAFKTQNAFRTRDTPNADDASSARPAGTGVTAADYQRAERFSPDRIGELVYHLDVNPQWDNNVCWYVTNTREGRTFYRIDAAKRTVEKAFDHQRLAAAASAVSGKTIRREELPFSRIGWENERTITFVIDSVKYRASLDNYQVSELEKLSGRDIEKQEATSPDGRLTAFVKDHNLYIRPTGHGDAAGEFPLSTDGRPRYEYASYLGWSDIMEGENGKRPGNFTATWSPDSRRILTQITDLRRGNKMYLLDWSIDSLYRPKLLSYYRGSPGDTNIVYYIPVIFDVASRKMVKADLPPLPHFMGNPLRWSEDGSFLYGLYWHRGYQRMDVIRVDPATGKVSVKFSDTSSTNVEGITSFRLLQKEGIAFITSERSGWNQLYRLDWKSGAVRPLTNGAFVVQDIKRIDEERKLLYFTAGGREAGRNPYFSHLYCIGFDGKGLKLLTPEDAHHETELSPDNSYFVDNYSKATRPAVSVLRKLPGGELLMELGRADISDLLATGWNFPEVFSLPAGDGETPLYGALWKPSEFDEAVKYPLVDNSYTGPQASVFPKSFRDALFTTAQPLAEFGFVVMAVDGRGTAGRSKSFHNRSYKRLGFGLEDHVTAIRRLAENYSWIDTTRIGIYGHSAGGYDAAHALMLFPDFYKVAVASSGDHDHRMEKAWWPEMYMGWPVDSAYELQSNVTMAPQMKGKLLLVHGGIDENVNPSATFKLAEALIRAGKDFDMLIIPGARHGYAGQYGEYFTRKRWNYFIEHLLQKQPLADLPADKNTEPNQEL